MTDCLPILFYNSPSVSRGVQRLIILLFCSNGKCPSSAPLINKLNVKVDQRSTAARRDKDVHAPELCKRTRRTCICRHTKRRGGGGFLLLVIEHFHAAVLLNPKLTNDDIVHTTGGVCPGVGLIISAKTKMDDAHLKRIPIRRALQLQDRSPTWAAPAWWVLWAQLRCSSPKISV